MTDFEQVQMLIKKLEELDRRIVPEWQRPMIEVGRIALEAKITELGRRLRHTDYLHGKTVRRASA